MPTTYIIGLLLLLQLTGCTVSRTETVSGTLQGGTVVVERLPPAATPGQAGLIELPRSADTPGGTLIIERLPPLPEVVPEVPVAAAPPISPAIAPVAPAAATLPEAAPASPVPSVTATPTFPAPPAATTAATVKPAAKAPDKAVAPVVLAPPAPKPSAPPARVAAPTLDLDALEKRLKDTDAIGVFTKIALKNQVDDLLKRFKTYHENDGKTALAQLRQSYDQLLLKVNDVLKTGDPSLAGEIMGSREAIWGVLSDPVKFAKL